MAYLLTLTSINDVDVAEFCPNLIQLFDQELSHGIEDADECLFFSRLVNLRWMETSAKDKAEGHLSALSWALHWSLVRKSLTFIGMLRSIYTSAEWKRIEASFQN